MAKIKRIGVLKFASFSGLYGVFIGLLMGILFTLISSIGLPSSDTGLGALKVLFGVGAIIFLPIFYGVMGFVMGLIISPIINLVLKIIKGLDLDIEMHETSRQDDYQHQQEDYHQNNHQYQQ